MRKYRKNFIAFTVFLSWLSIYYSLDAQVIDYPKASLTLKIKGDGGKNGSSVVYNPDRDYYYSVIAGNTQYPLEVFDSKGNSLYQTESGNDMRGLWWNSKDGSLEGNCYADVGILKFGLDNNGYPSRGNSVLFSGGDYQPNEHSCGVYDSKKKQIIYYNAGKIYAYKRSSGSAGPTLELSISSSKLYDINTTSVIYTGVKGMEFGVLDFVDKKVYLFDRKTGKQTRTINLPFDAITNDFFRFSYANGYVFLFDTESRSWTGYRIFE